MTKYIFCIFFSLAVSSVQSQPLSGIYTRFSDSFSEWVFARPEADDAGELRRRWLSREDWTEWDYRIGERSGQIRLKWSGNPNEWEVRGDNFIVMARTIWNDNFTQWRISDGRNTLELRTRFNNALDEWEKPADGLGYFRMYTAAGRDPRDWIIVDELSPEISLPLKIALVFIVVIHNIPRS